MKPETLHSLITARVLLDESKRLIDSEDRHLCTAGLISLQDSLELIVLALLRERGVDNKKNIEAKGFDELLGELRSDGVSVPKIGTLKAMNKERVVCKHFGQLAEPVTVRNYLGSVIIAVDRMTNEVIGQNLNDVYITDLLDNGEGKEYLANASVKIGQGDYLDALIEIRKAIYVEIEHDYSVFSYRPGGDRTHRYGLLGLGAGGRKAPFFTKNKEWVEKNVKDPLDYVQIDYERIRIDAMEWGVHTEELNNVIRLTPDVFRADPKAEWKIRYDLEFPHNHANQANCSYCLDRTLAILLKKHLHSRVRRTPERRREFEPPPIYIGQNVHSSATTKSEIVHTVNDEEFEYFIHGVVSGFEDGEMFYKVSGSLPPADDEFVGQGWFSGYLLVQDES